MRKSAYGFSLVELLVVIALMVIVGVLAISNYKSFGEDQNLKNAVLDIQSKLRAAQSNATSNTICNTQYSATWEVEFKSTTEVNLRCQEPLSTPTLKKTLTLGTNIVIQTVSGIPSPSCPSGMPFEVSFAPLSGEMTIGSDAGCIKLTLTLKNNKTNSTKDLIIEKGGPGSKGVKIYAE